MKNKLILLFHFILILFTSCNSDDNSSNPNDDDIIEKRLIRTESTTNGIELIETYTYDNITGYVKEKNSRNSKYTYLYNGNNIEERHYRNNSLVRIKYHTKVDNTYTIKWHDSNNVLYQTSTYIIENKKPKSYKVIESNGQLTTYTQIFYENNDLKEITKDIINNQVSTKINNGVYIKNFHSPFAYMVNNTNSLTLENHVYGSESVYFEYEYDNDNYPKVIYFYNSNRELIDKINYYYQ